MARDLFQERGINPLGKNAGRDLFQDRGINNQTEKNPFIRGVESVNEFGDKYLAPIGSAGAGVAQGLGDIGASVANLALSAFTNKRIPHPNLGKYVQPGFANKAGFIGGEVASNILPLAHSAKAINSLARPKGWSGIASDLARGGALGFSVGERADEGFDPFGRSLGAVLGAVGNLGIQSTKGPLSSKGILEDISKDKRAAQSTYNNLYDSLFKKAEVNSGKAPALNINKLKDEYGLDAAEAFKKSPSAKTAHYAKSEAQSIVRSLNKIRTNSGGSFPRTGQAKELEQAEKLVDQFNSYLESSLSNGKNKSLLDEYKKISEGYKKDVVPYLDKTISQYQAGDIFAPAALKAIQNDRSLLYGKLNPRNGDKIIPGISEKYPEIEIRKAFGKFNPLNWIPEKGSK